jgi:hypothetical protein
MPRKSSQKKSPVSKPVSKPSYTQPHTPIPSPSSKPQTIQVQHETPSMWSSVKQGFGWGVGTSIARNIFGGNTETIVKEQIVEAPAKIGACFNEDNLFKKCLKEEGSGMCYQHEEILKKCFENNKYN